MRDEEAILLFGQRPAVFHPAPREYSGNMCGMRLPYLPPVPGGAADPSLFLSWFYHLYDAPTRARIRTDYLARYPDWLLSWPDAQDAGVTPQQFRAQCQEIIATGGRPCVMLSAKPISSATIRDIQGTLDNILLVLPLLVGVVPRFCIGWELSLWLSPADVQFLIDAIAPIVHVQPGTKLYVHFQQGYGSFQVSGDFADFWNINVGKLTGILREEIIAQTPDERRYASGGVVDVLIRFAGNFNVVPDSGFGHPFDDIELEISAQNQFDGIWTETQGDWYGRWAINTPGQTGPAGLVVCMGSGNGQ